MYEILLQLLKKLLIHRWKDVLGVKVYSTTFSGNIEEDNSNVLLQRYDELINCKSCWHKQQDLNFHSLFDWIIHIAQLGS